MYSDSEFDPKLIKKVVVPALLILVTISIALGSFTTIPSGSKGIVTSFGAASEKTLGEGLHFKIPIVHKIVKVDVKTQKEEVGASSATSDLQSVSTTVAVNYHLDEKNVTRVYRTIGLDFKGKVIDPVVQESVKSVTAKYTASDLIRKREEVKAEIQEMLRLALAKNDLIVTGINIVDFKFAPQFDAAIEAKVKAEQDALAAKNKLEQVKAEAEQSIAKARAEAESIKLQSDAADNDKFIELKRLEVQAEYAKKWNGVLPVNLYGSAPIPFLSIK